MSQRITRTIIYVWGACNLEDLNTDAMPADFVANGETSCYKVYNDEEDLAKVAWWEEGDETYTVARGNEVETFDNHPWALTRYNEIVNEGLRDDEDGEIKIVLGCDNEVLEKTTLEF